MRLIAVDGMTPSHRPFPRNTRPALRCGWLWLFRDLLLTLVGHGREFALVREYRSFLDRLAPEAGIVIAFVRLFLSFLGIGFERQKLARSLPMLGLLAVRLAFLDPQAIGAFADAVFRDG